MESIREIVSFSHSGMSRMWYPFCATLSQNNSVISGENIYEISELLNMLRSMFATNNHSPDGVNKTDQRIENRFSSLRQKNRTTCSIVFRTEKNEYLLRRRFLGVFSVEATIQKLDSSVIYYGLDAIRTLGKFHKPFVVSGDSIYAVNSLILKPDTEFSRTSMTAMANSWARMVGVNDPKIELDYNGKWSVPGDIDPLNPIIYPSKAELSPPLMVLTHLAQAVMRKRRFGNCPPVFTQFNINGLNPFEAIALLDLIKNVCIEENIQFIIGMNSNSEIDSVVEVISTPSLSVYQK